MNSPHKIIGAHNNFPKVDQIFKKCLKNAKIRFKSMKVSGNSEFLLKNVNTCRKINKSREKLQKSTEFSAEKE